MNNQDIFIKARKPVINRAFGLFALCYIYFFYDGRRIVLTHGFIKKTQKTPPAEIKRAKGYREEYRSRKENIDE